MSEGGGSFLSRWSRRKRAAAVAAPVAPPPPPAPAAPPEAAPPEDAAAPGGAPPAFDPASLPPLESLTAESDFAAFLREEVPAALRRAALRRAWSLDPAIRDFVGPADYAWDYNAPGGVPGFSLEVPKNLERLIAQAIGSGPSEEEQQKQEEEAPPAQAAAAPPPPPSEPLALEGPQAAAASVGAPAGEGPAPEELPAPVAAAPVAEALPLRRRHGGAVPS